MYEVELIAFNAEDGSVAVMASATIEDLGSPSGFGVTETAAIHDLREEIARRRSRVAKKLPLPEGYPRSVLVEL